jgi:Na+-driven multidrug efflux pump
MCGQNQTTGRCNYLWYVPVGAIWGFVIFWVFILMKFFTLSPAGFGESLEGPNVWHCTGLGIFWAAVWIAGQND